MTAVDAASNASRRFFNGEKNISTVATVAILIIVAIGVFRTPTWEYHVAAPNDLVLASELQSLGKEGWEIVSSRRASSSSGDGASYEMIFKRPRGMFSFSSSARQSVATQPSPSNPSSAVGYPAPDSPRAKVSLRSCIDGVVNALEGEKWVVFQIAGSTLPCRMER